MCFTATAVMKAGATGDHESVVSHWHCLPVCSIFSMLITRNVFCCHTISCTVEYISDFIQYCLRFSWFLLHFSYCSVSIKIVIDDDQSPSSSLFLLVETLTREPCQLCKRECVVLVKHLIAD